MPKWFTKQEQTSTSQGLGKLSKKIKIKIKIEAVSTIKFELLQHVTSHNP
jgi:hypothetical protein